MKFSDRNRMRFGSNCVAVDDKTDDMLLRFASVYRL